MIDFLEKALRVLWLVLLVLMFPLAVAVALVLAAAPATVLVLGLLVWRAAVLVQRAQAQKEME
jgi:hypothetical protein